VDILNLDSKSIDQAILKELGFADAGDFEMATAALNPTENRLLFSRYAELLESVKTRIRSGGSQDIPLASEWDWEKDYWRKPPTMRQFIEDPFWLGSTLLPSEDSVGIFPTWREILLQDFDMGSTVHNLVITGSLGIGKCLGYNELCLMHDGAVKPVQQIQVGDLLMGDDSTPRRVMSTMSGRGPLYQIYPSKGEPFVCNGAHILCLKSSVSDEIEHVSVEDFLKWPIEKKNKARLYRVPVEWAEKTVLIDPYWLGLWLGDGTSRRVEITTMDEAIRDYHIAYCSQFPELNLHVYNAGKGAKASSYTFTVPRGSRYKNPVRLKLEHYGLTEWAQTCPKFIPNDYLYNSRSIRLKLFAGLIDTDGSKSRGGKCTAAKRDKASNGVYEITVKYERFANQIRFLAQSLGFFAQTKVKIVNSTAYYRTIISGAYDVPSLLERKVSRARGTTLSPLTGHVREANCLKTKFAVIPKGDGDYYGFEIDGNHRFLLKDFTVTHNTYVMVTILLYRLTLATLLRNPSSFFGLGAGSKIIYNVLSVTKTQVQETAFGDAQNFMARSEYFLKDCDFDPDSKHSNFRVELPGDIYFTAGSKGWHVLGRNVLGVALDEGNWRNEADPDTKAYDLYNEVRVRIQNRFMRSSKFLPAISILASSARDESSFTEKVIKEIEKVNDPKHQLVYRHAVYKIKRHVLKLSGNWFKVCYGLKTQEPYVMTGIYAEDGTPLPGETHEQTPQGASVELVPVEYLPDFKRRPRTALQSVSGISTGGSNRFFPTTIDVERCIELAEHDGIVDPARPGVKFMSVSTEDDTNVWDYLDHNKFLTKVASVIQPRRHPSMARFAHLDLATQTMAGLAVCHLVNSKLVEGLVDKSGNPFSEYRLIVEYDFILTITAGRTKPISLEKIQNFILWLAQKCNYRFAAVTADQYQSSMPLQMLESRGFKTDLLSVDRDKKVYTAWRQAFEELRLRPYRSDQLTQEIECLVDDGKKVDHPKDGSKDTSDACFALETLVRTLDGQVRKIGELQPGQKCWVYSLDTLNRVVAGNATALGITRRSADLLGITLDNGCTIKVTPDHLLMRRDGSYIRADSVTPGMSMMPFYFKRNAKGRGRVFNPHTNKFEFVYRLIDEQLRGAKPPGFCIHHEDLRKINDQPGNLKRLTNGEHWALHHDIKLEDGRATELKRQKNLADYNAKPETKFAARLRVNYARKFSKDRITQAIAAIPRLLSTEFRAQHSLFMREYMSDPATRYSQIKGLLSYNEGRKIKITIEDLVRLRGQGMTNRDISEIYGCSVSVVERSAAKARHLGVSMLINFTRYRSRFYAAERVKKVEKVCQLRDHGATVIEACKAAGITSKTYYDWSKRLNHKVISVQNLPPEPVSCLRVDIFHNFALEDGIFVHNCAGAYYDAITSEEKFSVSVDNSPSIIGNNSLSPAEVEKPPMEITLPMGYTKIKSFS